ncbi:hypothetical protein L9F63_015292, partial [Diploptera punctata]
LTSICKCTAGLSENEVINLLNHYLYVSVFDRAFSVSICVKAFLNELKIL